MIINGSLIEQPIDLDEKGRFFKELVVVRAGTNGEASPDGGLEGAPLAMVRKRAVGPDGAPLPTRAPVVLLHGYGQNRYAWHLPSRSFFNYLARAGFDVFNLELRGHGRSRHLGAHPPKHLTEFVEQDVPAAIDEIQRLSGGRPVFMVGHSLGGLISYASAAKLSDRIAGVVSLGSPYQFTRGSWSLSLIASAMSALEKTHLPAALAPRAIELRPLSETMRLMRAFIESPIFPLPIRGFAPGAIEARVLGQHMSLAMDVGSVAVLRMMFMSAHEARQGGKCLGELTDYADDFETLAKPLLVIAGNKDDLAPPASVEPAYLRSRSPDKTYRAFPQGHIDLIMGKNCPHTIWPLISQWIARRSPAEVRRAA